MTPPGRVRWARGRFVHYAGWWHYPTVCRQVMSFHKDRAIPTDRPVTCRKCFEIAARYGWPQ